VLTAARPDKTWVVNTGYTVNTCFFENIFIYVEHAYTRKKRENFGLLGTDGIDRSVQGRKNLGCRCQYLLCLGIDKVLTGRNPSVEKHLCFDQQNALKPEISL